MSDQPHGGAPFEDERAWELLVQRVSVGLTATEEAELRERLAHLDGVDEDYLDLAAAAVELVGHEARVTGGRAVEPPPADLGDKLLASARAHLPMADAESQDAGSRQTDGQRAPAESNVTPFARPAASAPRAASALGWWAAAACAAIAAIGWWMVLRGPQAGVEPVEPAPAVAEKSLEERVREAPDTVILGWTATEDEAALGTGGELAWSNARQEGYMRLGGLAANDPRTSQYQLWIFDATRDERYPVDGGVFDVAATGEILVPIRARLEVHDPKLFAVTVEKPGGVVVSSRERIVLLASVPEMAPAEPASATSPAG